MKKKKIVLESKRSNDDYVNEIVRINKSTNNEYFFEIGTEVTKTTDSGPDATKGVPTATPPGATPPVGSEPMKKITGQPSEKGSVEAPEGKPGTQKMEKNKGATFQSYGQKNEDEELDGEVVAEAEDKEGHEDEKKDKAMMKKMMAKKDLKEDKWGNRFFRIGNTWVNTEYLSFVSAYKVNPKLTIYPNCTRSIYKISQIIDKVFILSN
jgi:hypothetical protein